MKILLPCLLAVALSSAPAATLLTSHLDIRFAYQPGTGTWNCVLQYGGTVEDPTIQIDTEDAAMPVWDFPANTGDRLTQPASATFAFTGATPGQPLWNLPQTNRGNSWPGWDNEQIAGTFLSYLPADSRVTIASRWWKVSLVDVEYSGAHPTAAHFSAWQTGSLGSVTVWMATTDGISASDCYYSTENSHSHVNFGFNALGIYRVTFRASAFLAGSGALTESGEHAVTFAVGTLATWRATHFSGPDLVDSLVGTPEADPDGDELTNLLEYACNTDPTVPSTATLVPGSGTAGLPVVLTETLAGQPTLTVEFVRRKASGNPQITYTPEFSSTLAADSWQAAASTTVTSIDATWERVKAVDATPVGTRRFARVRVTLQSQIPY
jgi:surface-anchored protein